MREEYETADPLQLLLVEWRQVGLWFWTFLGAGGMVAFALPERPVVAILLGLAGLGQAVLRLGNTLIVSANEVRKELRATDRALPAADQEPAR